MKLSHYLKDYTLNEKKLLAPLCSGMDYNFKLKLVSKFNKSNLPATSQDARYIRDFIEPLSNQKKINVLLNSSLHQIPLPCNKKQFTTIVKNLSRKNKIKTLNDLIKISNQCLVSDVDTTPFSYEGKWAKLLTIDGLSFSVNNQEYSFYLPKDKKDFLIAAYQLKTCVFHYANRHLKDLFKFFIKKDGKFFCSVEMMSYKHNGHIGLFRCCAVNNTKPARDIQIAIKKALKPFYGDLYKEDTSILNSAESLPKKILYSMNPLKFYHSNEIDPTHVPDPALVYYEVFYTKGKIIQRRTHRFENSQWMEFGISSNNEPWSCVSPLAEKSLQKNLT